MLIGDLRRPIETYAELDEVFFEDGEPLLIEEGAIRLKDDSKVNVGAAFAEVGDNLLHSALADNKRLAAVKFYREPAHVMTGAVFGNALC